LEATVSNISLADILIIVLTVVGVGLLVVYAILQA